MEDRYTPTLSEKERAARRAQREKARQKKRRARRRRQLLVLAPVLVLAAALVGLLSAWASHREPEEEASDTPQLMEASVAEPEESERQRPECMRGKVLKWQLLTARIPARRWRSPLKRILA